MGGFRRRDVWNRPGSRRASQDQVGARWLTYLPSPLAHTAFAAPMQCASTVETDLPVRLLSRTSTSLSRSTWSQSRALPVEKDLIVDMTPFYKAYLEINPFLVATDKTKQRAPPISRRPCPLRRHHQVHPLCRLHKQLSCVLDRWSVLRPSCNRERPPIHL